MPFNPSGIFERLYSWVTDRDNGVKILAQRVDDETNGIVAGINQLTSGAVGFRGPIRTVNGTKGTPSFAFKDDPNTGMYRVGEDVLGLTGGTGDLQVGPTTLTYNGGKVYHAGDKPTAADVGAPSLAGANTFAGLATFKARVDIDAAAEAKLRLMGSGIAIVEAYNAGGTRTGVLTFDNAGHLFRLYLDAAGGQPAARMELTRAGVLSVNGQAVYHTGNKPTAADTGAVPVSGDQDITGLKRFQGGLRAVFVFRIESGTTAMGWQYDGTTFALRKQDTLDGPFTSLVPMAVNATSGLVTFNNGIRGSGAELTALNAGELTSGFVPQARLAGGAVRAVYASGGAGDVGTFATLRLSPGGAATPGQIVPASAFDGFASASGDRVSGTVTGSWRCMGNAGGNSNGDRTTLFMRVS